MRKRRSEFAITPEEELDQQHQGSLVGAQLFGRYGRVVSQGGVSEMTPGQKPAEERVERSQKKSPERQPTKGPQQAESAKKHHYK